ncbi:MAG: class I SAM-dependent methyltransferase [Thermoleophilaceae bacterium]|nr:class I SAM-dependent methyltransferase [Thermoleophilaceae bacterium]
MPSLDAVDWGRFDFLDLGCSRGASTAYCRRRFGARRGIGVDLDPVKVGEAVRAGHEAVQADATTLEVPVPVRFVSMIDFLEHLPGLEAVEAVLGRAASVATDFLYIQHPSFEGEGFVEGLGVRQYWWHWSGHTAHPQVADYCSMFERLGLDRYSIRFRGLVRDSRHPSVIPLGTRKNQHAFDPALHPPKPHLTFARPLWQMQEIVIALRPFRRREWARIVKGGVVWRARHRLVEATRGARDAPGSA